MTRRPERHLKPLPELGNIDATSRISSPIVEGSSRLCSPVRATPEARRRCIVLVNQKGMGTNELGRRYPLEWNAFKGMKLRERRGQGIVDERLATFRAFLLVMGPAPTPEHRTVDRLNPYDPVYAPGKVRWATSTEQANNRRSTIVLDHEGEKVPLAIVAKATGQKADTMRKRLRMGWTQEEVIAGERFVSGPAPIAAGDDVSDGSGRWPKGITLSKWSAPFLGWVEALRMIGQASGATEAVFVAWIADNQARGLARMLWERHRISLSREHYRFRFGPELPADVRDDPVYRLFDANTGGALAAEKMIGSDPAQCARLAWLRQSGRPKVSEPKDAPGAFRLRKVFDPSA